MKRDGDDVRFHNENLERAAAPSTLLTRHSHLMAACCRRLVSGLLVLMLVGLALVPLSWQSQALAGALLVAGAILLALGTRSRPLTMALVIVSGFATVRYAIWRVIQTWQGVTSAGHLRQWDTVPVIALLAAELLAIGMLAAGYLSSLRATDAPHRDASADEPILDTRGRLTQIAPRAVFLLAPLASLLFGVRTFYGAPLVIAAYALPHLVIAHLTNARLHGCWAAFWNEIGDAVLAPSARVSSLCASIGARLHLPYEALFHDGAHERSHPGVRVLLPFVVLLGVSVAALAAASQRLMTDPAQRDIVILNALWTAYNVVVLSIGAAVARQRLRRSTGMRSDRNQPVNRRHRRTATVTASIVVLAVLAPPLIDADDATQSEFGSGGRVSGRDVSGSPQLPVGLIDGGRDARVPVVFASAPTAEELKAAAIVASWFGIAAEGRDVRFPVSIGALPDGHAIVIARAGSVLARSLALDGRRVAELRESPKSGGGRLLVISGAGSMDILAAANAFVARQLPTPVVVASGAGEPAAEGRAAPRWLSAEAAVPLAAGSGAGPLTIEGTGSLRVPFRIPPDLFLAGRQTVPLRLRFSYGGATTEPFTPLRIRVNGHDVDSIRLAPSSAATEREETVWLPTAQLRPYLNTLTFDSDLGPRIHAGVSHFIAFDRQSTIDVRGLPHSIVLPRLDLLAEAGYPFTAFADLSRTAVVLPDAPTPRDYETVLNVARQFAAQTGAPVSGLAIVDPAHADSVRDKDLLVLGTPAAQPLLARWAGSMPLAFTSNGTQINPQAGSSPWVNSRWPFQRRDRDRLARLVGAGYTFDAVIEQFVSPLRSDRSVVALIAGDDGETTATALTPARRGTIDGGIAVARDGRFESFRLAVAPFRGGEPDLIDRLRVTVIDASWITPVVVLLIALVLASAHTPRASQPA